MFVSRRQDGSIYGRWATRQFAEQEELAESHPDLIALRDAEAARPKPPTVEQRLAALETRLAALEAARGP